MPGSFQTLASLEQVIRIFNLTLIKLYNTPKHWSVLFEYHHSIWKENQTIYKLVNKIIPTGSYFIYPYFIQTLEKYTEKIINL